MENISSSSIITSSIGVSILLVVYIVYIYIRNKRSKAYIHAFLRELAHSFHEAEWEYIYVNKNILSPEELAENINKKLQKDMNAELDDFFAKLFYFPRTCSRISIQDETTSIFIEKIFPRLQELYHDYKYKRKSIENVKKQFFLTSNDIILSHLQKKYTISQKN